jgi:hypothetical protein
MITVTFCIFDGQSLLTRCFILCNYFFIIVYEIFIDVYLTRFGCKFLTMLDVL